MAPTSPKDLQDYYEKMEKHELERKQSRGKSRRWTLRGSAKGSQVNEKKIMEHREMNPSHSSLSERESERDVQGSGKHTPPVEHVYDASDDSRSLSDLRADSLVPPLWSYDPSEEDPSRIAPPSSYRSFYKIHNPVGPRYYRNQHLRPSFNNPALSAALRPASAFSSAFPPLSALPPGSPPLHGLGFGHTQLNPRNYSPQPSSSNIRFSSSESVLPTPDSTQPPYLGQSGEIQRKNNAIVNGPVVNGAAGSDPVDQLDGSDPYGQKFHHDSPYDLGKKGKGNEKGSRNGTWAPGSSSVTDVSG